MAVIINEFEVVVEPPRSSEDQGQETPVAPAQQQAMEPLSPFSLEMVMRQRLQRQARVRAD